MILNIPQLREVEDLQFEMDGEACQFPEEAGKLKAPVRVTAHIRKIGTEITITGRISTMVEMACARCLKPHDEILTDTFEVAYHPLPTLTKWNEEVELTEADMSTSYYEGETISLSELVHDQVVLLLPIQPLCHPACAGLCPSCGKNLNKGPCGCSTRAGDPRLAVLGQLLQRES